MQWYINIIAPKMKSEKKTFYVARWSHKHSWRRDWKEENEDEEREAQRSERHADGSSSSLPVHQLLVTLAVRRCRPAGWHHREFMTAPPPRLSPCDLGPDFTSQRPKRALNVFKPNCLKRTSPPDNGVLTPGRAVPHRCGETRAGDSEATAPKLTDF